MKRTEMKAACKFRAACADCGAKQPRATTAWTAQRWMADHEASHRIEETQ